MLDMSVDLLERKTPSFRLPTNRKQAEIYTGFWRKNRILVRALRRIHQLHDGLSGDSAHLLKSEERRVGDLLDIIKFIQDSCQKGGSFCMFHKANLHYPDMGHDVDLLIEEKGRSMEPQIVDTLGLQPDQTSLSNTLARKSGYCRPEGELTIEIHRDRLGQVGEHKGVLDALKGKAREVDVGGVKIMVPGPEDMLIIQSIQRIFMHRSVRLSDVIFSRSCLRSRNFDCGLLRERAKQWGVWVGVKTYLRMVLWFCECQHLPIPLPFVLRRELSSPQRRYQWGETLMQVPSRDSLAAYLALFLGKALSWNIGSCLRLSFLPIVAGHALMKRIPVIGGR